MSESSRDNRTSNRAFGLYFLGAAVVGFGLSRAICTESGESALPDHGLILDVDNAPTTPSMVGSEGEVDALETTPDVESDDVESDDLASLFGSRETEPFDRPIGPWERWEYCVDRTLDERHSYGSFFDGDDVEVGESLLLDGGPLQSVSEYERATTAQPLDPVAHLGLAYALERAGEFDRAVEHYCLLGTLDDSGEYAAAGSERVRALVRDCG